MDIETILCPYCKDHYLSARIDDDIKNSDFIRFGTCENCGATTKMRYGYIKEYKEKNKSQEVEHDKK